jgi:hypothetical protein
MLPGIAMIVSRAVFVSSSSTRPPISDTPHSQRRQVGGARVESSERVVIRAADIEVTGWTLNISRGGLRAVLEQPIEAGREYLVVVGESGARRACVAWAKGEADGQIVGLRFLDVDGSVPPEAG